eukprot:gene2879-3580_t
MNKILFLSLSTLFMYNFVFVQSTFDTTNFIAFQPYVDTTCIGNQYGYGFAIVEGNCVNSDHDMSLVTPKDSKTVLLSRFNFGNGKNQCTPNLLITEKEYQLDSCNFEYENPEANNYFVQNATVKNIVTYNTFMIKYYQDLSCQNVVSFDYVTQGFTTQTNNNGKIEYVSYFCDQHAIPNQKVCDQDGNCVTSAVPRYCGKDNMPYDITCYIF